MRYFHFGPEQTLVPGFLSGSRPQTAIIPQSMAENLFEGDAVGKILRTDGNWFFPEGELTVGAVYEDFPSNSNLQNSIYFAREISASRKADARSAT